MKLTIALPVYNQLEDTKGVWGCHIANIQDKENVELLVIDNGSTDGTRDFIEHFVFPHFPDHTYVFNPENVGVIASMNQAIQESRGDVIAILHNDLYVFEPGWDTRVVSEFENDTTLGLAGFLGAKGCGTDGGRMWTMSNMLEAEIHGAREIGVQQCVLFDGMSLIGRREMFEQVDGFDTGYTFHHYYDKSISLDSHLAGWKNKVIGVSCHHRSGVTANRFDYQTWIDKKMGTTGFTGDLASYKASERHFLEKYRPHLPAIIR